jgi:uncharacterized protein (UPF0333 family)
MVKPKTNHTRVSITEKIVVLVVLVVLVIVGSFAYKQHINSTKTDNKSTTSSSSGQSTQKYLVISQWGVEATYTGNVTLSYIMSADDKIATFSSNELTAASNACVGRGGSIERWASTDTVSELPADPSAPTAAQYFASALPSTYAHVGNYYYSFQHDQAACGDPSTTSSLYAQTNNAVQSMIANLKSD